MKLILGVLCILAGLALWVLAVTALVSWIVFCFGTVVIGIVLLIFAPHILLFPLVIATPGTGLIAIGVAIIGQS